ARVLGGVAGRGLRGRGGLRILGGRGVLRGGFLRGRDVQRRPLGAGGGGVLGLGLGGGLGRSARRLVRGRRLACLIFLDGGDQIALAHTGGPSDTELPRECAQLRQQHSSQPRSCDVGVFAHLRNLSGVTIA